MGLRCCICVVWVGLESEEVACRLGDAVVISCLD